ncbi:hypothetical protein AOY73_18055 [Escherichia coli]|nr:hypothetical protein AOY73_18055 [Escherichia coli]
MFILPPCEEGTTIQIVQVWVGSPRVDRNIVLGLHLSRPQSKPETGKLQAPAVILPFLSKIAVYLWVFPDHGGKAQNAIFSFP